MGFRLANVEGRAVLVVGDHFFDVAEASGGSLPSDPMQALEYGMALRELSANLGGGEPTGALADVRLSAPVPRPRNSLAVGLNYKNHAEESGLPIPDAPMVFCKFPSCITGPTGNVEMRSDYVDFEGELVVVIGKEAKQIAEEDALNYVAGFCIGQDISDRPAQFTSTPPQFNLGKSFDTYGPIGPVLVSPDAIDPDTDLMLTTEVNGEVRQRDSAKDLIFDVPFLIAYLSQILTLYPGDLIFTGTPGGVGVMEGRFLRDGDLIRTTIEGLGSMENRCVRVADHSRASVIPDALKSALANAAKNK
jgi:2-keto-4-pentenoate hydratase/2-oxohepta-3-ene-1,7-dioic acid hydratase in catechol pathway